MSDTSGQFCYIDGSITDYGLRELLNKPRNELTYVTPHTPFPYDEGDALVIGTLLFGSS
jgi:hypothetical protein